MVELTPELKELFNNWVNLTLEQKQAVNHLLSTMNNKSTPAAVVLTDSCGGGLFKILNSDFL